MAEAETLPVLRHVPHLLRGVNATWHLLYTTHSGNELLARHDSHAMLHHPQLPPSCLYVAHLPALDGCWGRLAALLAAWPPAPPRHMPAACMGKETNGQGHKIMLTVPKGASEPKAQENQLSQPRERWRQGSDGADVSSDGRATWLLPFLLLRNSRLPCTCPRPTHTLQRLSLQPSAA